MCFVTVLVSLKTCGPLWAQQCGNQYYTTGVCSDVSPDFQLLASFSPAVQSKLWQCRGSEQHPTWQEGEQFINKCHPSPQRHFGLSLILIIVKFESPMELCFSHLFPHSLPFPHRCCGCVWWIKQYLSLGCSKEFLGKICTRPGYRPHKDTGMDTNNTHANPWLSSWEDTVRYEVLTFHMQVSQLLVSNTLNGNVEC